MAGEGDLKAKYAAIVENRDRLDACPRHLFPAVVPGIEGGVMAMFGQKIKCTLCGGEMRLDALNYYVRGYEASGKSGNDILPGWREVPTNEPERRFFGQGQADPV